MKGVRKCHANENHLQYKRESDSCTTGRQKLEERLVLTGKETLAKPPTWLIDARAKNEFKRLVKEFEKWKLM